MSQTSKSMPIALIVMGPSSTGKTTTAELLSQELKWEFAEGDTFHPASNIEKMSAGIPLDDADRQPWLEKIRDWISEKADAGENVVITCSALKRSYRDILASARADVRFIELVADKKLVAERMAMRKGHFMPPSLLESQFATLQVLQPDENGVKVTVDAPPKIVVERALSGLALTSHIHQ
ncbi:gluconokinase [Rhizobium sp. SGZ-381]|uniref:gluconokinase n=1 Tax=Rhizobium sp. SGZ-381 TaxID=3342800 RepID=UPI00366F0C74